MNRVSQILLRLAYCLLFLLMPFYWCAPAVPMEAANFPMSCLEALFSSILPLPLFGAIAGGLLLWTALCSRGGQAPRRHPGGTLLAPLLALVPLAAGLAGLVHTTEWDYAGNWFLHFGSIAALTAGVWLASREDERLLPWLFNTVAVTAAISALHGWTQHFGGLQSTYEMQLQNAAETGVPLSQEFLLKLQQMRSYGSFCDPNVYAAHLLLTGPFLLVALYRIAQRCEASQRRMATWLLVGMGTVLLAGAILFSGSRGALVGAAAGMALFAWQRWLRRLSWKWLVPMALTAALLLGIGVLAISLRTNRRMETASVRAEYYACAWKIYRQFPLCGAGLGEFFNWHARLKEWNADDSRDPHSFFFSQLSQCGLPGACDALLRLAIPLALAAGMLKRLRRQRDSRQVAAVLAAWTAWTIHGLLQFNDLITSTAAIAACSALFVLEDGEHKENVRAACRFAGSMWLALAGLAVTVVSLAQMPRWYRLQELDNRMHDRFERPEVVAQELQKAMERYPRSLLACRMLCDFCTANPALQTVGLEAATEFARRGPHRSAAYNRLANFALRTGDRTLAAEALKTARLWYPTSPAAALTTGILALEGLSSAETFALSLWGTGHGAKDAGLREVRVHPLMQGNNDSAALFARRMVEALNALKLPSPDGHPAHVTFCNEDK